ncbi:ABC transporter substrate-binding protein [Mycolicibacterium anyangense]|uniref:ABC transporter substrate-binding protein n=2 Tax=Mycolicibacterium anyangense TaxID=1431246 RepID=A0A6N4WA11_9MYCO|nr:ABC transporter substrate-binding protein [Mycolicibacterium anyangense]
MLMVYSAFRRICNGTAALVLAALTAAAASSCGSAARPAATDYCAVMPDTVGLYVGNPVTQMGYPIGTVTSITPHATDVRVDFTVTENRSLPADVKAVIRSPSIVADRSLELVGNYRSGPKLEPNGCVPLQRSMSPKSLSEVIGSADTFLKAINPDGSSNIGDTIAGVNRLAQGNGARTGALVTKVSALVDNPDRAIGDIGSIVQNLAELTTSLTEMRGPMKEVLLDGVTTTPDLDKAMDGAARLGDARGKAPLGTLSAVIEMVSVLESRLGDETQLTLDTVSDATRKLSPHANALAAEFNPVPWWINTIANHYNAHQFSPFNIAYRPPMFRVQSHDGLALCGLMNAQMPGSCADVNGQPYAVDISLLQYVVMQASRK